VNIFSLRKSASLVLGGALVVSLAVPASAQSGGLNTNGTPNFGVRNVTPGFTPDPMNVNVTSGGSIDASGANLAPGCTGWVTSQPDFRINLTAADDFLRIYATGGGDTTLIINRANGSWACNDDSYGGTNPSVDLRNEGAGQIDVWVGSYQNGQQVRAVLHVTELESNHP
jgi:hypothetical protein